MPDFPSETGVDVCVIGGGIVGLATAMELLRRHPGVRLVVLEKEPQVAMHQTGRNSGVIHSGIYYAPGSLKAKLCVSGAAEMVAFCGEHGIALEMCGKVVVATREEEVPQLQILRQRGDANGVAGLRMLTPQELQAIEPHAAGVAALHVPGTGITDYSLVAQKYAEIVQQRGGEVRVGARVQALVRKKQHVEVHTRAAKLHAGMIINCAGLHSDRVARMIGDDPGVRIVPFRGEYYELRGDAARLVRGLIYPVPDPRFPFLGVHFTKKIHGGVEAGPNAVLALAREGYARTDVALPDVVSTFGFPGFWKMAAKYWRSGLAEQSRSWNKRAFTRELQRLLPEVQMADLRAGGSGVRAQALGRDGALVNDFHFVKAERAVHVLNVPSPAATASLAIARVIADAAGDSETAGVSP